MFFAYDTADDYEPLVIAAQKLTSCGFNRNQLRCYVLIGMPLDTIDKADKRLMDVLKLGIFPMAMLWKNDEGYVNPLWRKFQRSWARPAIIYRKNR
jgi:hypothetical protein